MIPERSFTRASILDGCVRRSTAREPIVAASAGLGIVAKRAEIAGADLILVLATGWSRHLGVPTTVNIGNATAMTLEMFPEVDNIVDAPRSSAARRRPTGAAGACRAPSREFRDRGFDGIGNFPTTGLVPRLGSGPPRHRRGRRARARADLASPTRPTSSPSRMPTSAKTPALSPRPAPTCWWPVAG